MLYQILEWGCMLGALAAFLYKVPVLARNKIEPALVALCGYFLLSFASYFLGLDFIWPHVARIFNNQYIAMILINVMVILLTAAQQIVLVYWSYPPTEARPRVRLRAYIFGSALVVMIGIFYWAQPSTSFEEAETANLINMHNLRFSAYLTWYLAVVAVGQIVTMRLCLRYAKMINRSWLRGGMQTVAVGSVLILIYCGMRFAEIVGVQIGADMTSWEPVRWLTADIGSLLELIGWTIPGWGPALPACRQWLADLRTYHRLRPLWTAHSQATPAIVKDPARSRVAEWLPLRDLGYRLHRRVVEIWDGQEALNPYLDPTEFDTALQQAKATGLTGDLLHAAARASQLHAALRAKANNQPAATGWSPEPMSVERGDPSEEEIQWLVLVAQAFTRKASPIGGPRDANRYTRR